MGVAIGKPGRRSRRRPRRLTLDHCTVIGAGFLRLVGFSQGSPVQIKARNCATRIESLLAWEPAAPDQPLNSQALRWSGDENHLDVAGRSWIVIPAHRDSATVSVSVSNLETWSQLARGKRSGPGLSGVLDHHGQPDGLTTAQ